MADILKTWPAFMDRRRVMRIFTHQWEGREFYFTLGRSKPKEDVHRLYWTHQGRIIGSFIVNRIVQNDGSLPRLRRLDGELSEWQIKPDHWVAICRGPMNTLPSHCRKIYHEGFRGWRYFDLGLYWEQPESRVRL